MLSWVAIGRLTAYFEADTLDGAKSGMFYGDYLN